MKKFLSGGISLICEVAIFLLGLASALTIKVSGMLSGKTDYSFYNLLSSDSVKDKGLLIAILVLLIGSTVVTLGSLAFAYLAKKKQKKLVKVVYLLASLLLIVTGILFFLINNKYGGSSDVILVKGTSSLGVGAIFAGIIGIAGGAASSFFALKA